jgi:hypothetical protein
MLPMQAERAAPAPVQQLLEDMHGWLASGDLVARVKTQVGGDAGVLACWGEANRSVPHCHLSSHDCCAKCMSS